MFRQLLGFHYCRIWLMMEYFYSCVLAFYVTAAPGHASAHSQFNPRQFTETDFSPNNAYILFKAVVSSFNLKKEQVSVTDGALIRRWR